MILLEIIIIAIVLILDQVSKLLIDQAIPLGGSVPLIEGVFELSNVHNTGAAWGIFPGARWFFIVLTVLVCAGIAFLLIKRRTRLGPLARVCLALLIGGAVGNLIDRIALSYVRDMLYFSLINFPVFNVADSAVSVGAVLLVIDMLFIKNGSVFSAIEREKPEQAEQDVQKTSAASAEGSTEDVKPADAKEPPAADQNAQERPDAD